MSACLQITMDEFLHTLKEQCVPPEHYAFKCVLCGNIQSVASLSKYISPEKAANNVYFCFEGRFTKKRGCDWTLGGLLKIHKMEVLKEDEDSAVCGILRAHPIFEPASREEAQALMHRNMAEAEMEARP